MNFSMIAAENYDEPHHFIAASYTKTNLPLSRLPRSARDPLLTFLHGSA